MGDPKLPLNGENSKIVIFVGSRRFDIAERLKSWKIAPVVVEHNDSRIGSDADDVDLQIRAWTFEAEGLHADAVLTKALLVREDKRKNRQAYEEISIGIILENRTPTPTSEDGFILSPCEMPPLDLASSGAAERIVTNLKGRAKYCKTATF